MDIPLPPEAARAWLQDLLSASAGSFGMMTRNFMSTTSQVGEQPYDNIERKARELAIASKNRSVSIPATRCDIVRQRRSMQGRGDA